MPIDIATQDGEMAVVYKVVYSGYLKSGIKKEIFIKEFSRVFKVPEAIAIKLAEKGEEVTLKQHLDYSSAKRYCEVMDGLGMQVYMVDEDVDIPDSSDNCDADFTNERNWPSYANELCLKCKSPHLMNNTCLACGTDNAELKAIEIKRARRRELKVRLVKVLSTFFPPMSKITVFVIAVTLYTAFLYIEWLPSPFGMILMFLKDIGREVGGSVVDMYMAILLTPILLIFLALLFIGPLLLPFTSLDLRMTCWLVVGLFVLITLTSSVYGVITNPDSLLSRLLLIYSVLWAVYLVYVIRFVEESGFIIGDDRVDKYTPFIAALVALVIVHVANVYYAMDWREAFVMSVAASTSLVTLMTKSLKVFMAR